MKQIIDVTLLDYYQTEQVSCDLANAISYSILAGGKRIRPLLCLELLEAFGVYLMDSHYQVAASLEMIHTGSLIHDDLPAMDNDDYRRGQLTNHKKFDEATAILAGDALFLDPFAVIAETDLKADTRLALIKELSLSSGSKGMVAGQMLDMKGEGQVLSLDKLRAIHENKTGRLLTFPFVAAALMAEQTKEVVEICRQIGQWVGLAFQIRDDILDLTQDFAELGKTPKKDISAEKATYPSLLGLDKAYELLDDSLDKAQQLLNDLAKQTNFQLEAMSQRIEGLRLNDKGKS